MPSKLALMALLAAVPALAVPAGLTRPTELRLIKTSESDPGQWVTEQEELDRFISKNIGFIDITDIKDEEVLSVLSADSSKPVKRQVTYPKGALHLDQGNKLLADVSTDGPKSWLKTYSE
ncbi:hypothetical protein J3458_021126 [Metarhizium acridum]|uniref:uncharacterized protein n=1 Tax=Metarhizium acridum TaxID=92637 RepID=UPI001C6ADFC6|nr:hypothetical protein J3458_021126 [Metarhizium acridum]